MNPICRFRAETVINASIDAVYAFHENPHNISQISPGWQRVQIMHAEPIAKTGESFHIRIRLLGILPLDWQGVWRETDRPGRLVDEMVSGPFAFWRHQHIFRALDPARTMMTDQVEYQFFGGWLGKVFGETLGRMQFLIMFADRQARTRRRLREGK